MIKITSDGTFFLVSKRLRLVIWSNSVNRAFNVSFQPGNFHFAFHTSDSHIELNVNLFSRASGYSRMRRLLEVSFFFGKEF